MESALRAAGDMPLIDPEKLGANKKLGDKDDADGFFGSLLDLFAERAPFLIREIEKGYEAMDAFHIERSAHALKGTAGNLGAIQLMNCAERLEHSGRAKDLKTIPALIQDLKRIYPQTAQELKKWR